MNLTRPVVVVQLELMSLLPFGEILPETYGLFWQVLIPLTLIHSLILLLLVFLAVSFD